MKGTLYIAATPIGNMEDITLRALKILKEETDYIYCEDTRNSKKLLSHYEIKLPVFSFHSYSSEKTIAGIIEKLRQGKTIAYLTDSGTPGISDPGAKIVRAAREQGIPIVPLPGASAVTTLLSVSGFPSKNIVFLGFLSRKENKIIKELEEFKEFKGIIVIFESPYRIKRLLPILNNIFPDSEIIIGRELTKYYEEFISGTVKNITKDLDNIKEKGEFTIAVYNNK
jgi:16S rRNA (cytidine1402-2'-O)-methyltransferase